MRRKYKILIIIAPAVFVLDQLTKLAVAGWIDFGARIPVIPGFFDLVYFRNTGAAFGMFSGVGDAVRVPFFYVVAAVAVVLLAFYYRSLKDDQRFLQLALSLVFAGIAGNVLDRIRLGSVVDFLSFHIGDKALKFALFGRAFDIALEWPAFNVADSAITVAMFLLVWSVLFGKEGKTSGE